MVLALQVVHGAIKRIEELVTQEIIVHEIELATGVGKGVAVALTREVHPPACQLLDLVRASDVLGVSKLVAFEVEIGFTSKSVGHKPGRVRSRQMQSYRIILCSAMPRSIMGVKGERTDMKSSSCQSSCLLINLTHFFVHEPKGQGFITDKRLVVAFSICDTTLKVTAVGESVHNVTQVPLVVGLFLKDLDPHVGDSH